MACRLKYGTKWCMIFTSPEATLALAICSSRERSVDEMRCPCRSTRVRPPRHQRLVDWCPQRLQAIVLVGSEQNGSTAKKRSCDI